MRVISTALGCDGVLADFWTGALRLIEEVTGKKFDPATVTDHDFTKVLDLTAQEISQVQHAISTRRGFAVALPPYPQARQGVRRLRQLGSVFCVTAPGESSHGWREERESWLALHFGIDHVHHAENGDTYPEADVFVDAQAKHVRAWLDTWPGRTAVFWQTPHNLREAVPHGAHSTCSWEKLYQIAREAAFRPAPPEESSP